MKFIFMTLKKTLLLPHIVDNSGKSYTKKDVDYFAIWIQSHNGFYIIKNNGKKIIGESIHKKIKFVKRLDDNHISSLFWSRIIN